MKKVDWEKFDERYKTTKNKTFNFRKEIYKYCKSDVNIFRSGCMKFRELFIQIATIDPFQYITIASVCQAIYRSEFVPENTIGICDEAHVDTYSVKAGKWLKYIVQKESIHIKHKGEPAIKINGKTYKVDGYCEETKTV